MTNSVPPEDLPRNTVRPVVIGRDGQAVPAGGVPAREDVTRDDNEGPPYDRRETAADPSHVHREEDVSNEDKALPSESNLSLILAGVALVLAIVAVILDAADFDAVSIVLAVSAVVVGGIATLMSWNDARGSPVVPGIVTAVAAVVLIISLLDVLGADEKARAIRDNETNLAAPAGTTVNGKAPANPAAIVDPHLAQDEAATQPAK